MPLSQWKQNCGGWLWTKFKPHMAQHTQSVSLTKSVSQFAQVGHTKVGNYDQFAYSIPKFAFQCKSFPNSLSQD